MVKDFSCPWDVVKDFSCITSREKARHGWQSPSFAAGEARAASGSVGRARLGAQGSYIRTCLEVSQNEGYPFGGPNNKEHSILGSILGSLYYRKLPFGHVRFSTNCGLFLLALDEGLQYLGV